MRKLLFLLFISLIVSCSSKELVISEICNVTKYTPLEFYKKNDKFKKIILNNDDFYIMYDECIKNWEIGDKIMIDSSGIDGCSKLYGVRRITNLSKNNSKCSGFIPE